MTGYRQQELRIGLIKCPVLVDHCNPLRREFGHVYADGAYDSKASHQLISNKGAPKK